MFLVVIFSNTGLLSIHLDRSMINRYSSYADTAAHKIFQILYTESQEQEKRLLREYWKLLKFFRINNIVQIEYLNFIKNYQS